MSLEEIREKNIRLVVEKAMDCFIDKGIEHTKIKDIAKAAGLTERSVFRYFPTKADIVQAAIYSFWTSSLEKIISQLAQCDTEGMNGCQQVRLLLHLYGQIFIDNPGGARFALDAEVALYNAGKMQGDLKRPPEPFEISDSPVVTAIRLGLEDGSIDPGCSPKLLYYNAYDAILGLQQRLSIEAVHSTGLDSRERLNALCDMFADKFAAKPEDRED